MRELYKIIEECKINREPSYEELRYATLALSRIINFADSIFIDLYGGGISPSNKLKIERFDKIYRKMLKENPKEWLGWSNDPENPEYQKFHEAGKALMEKALRGELSNQREVQNEI